MYLEANCGLRLKEIATLQGRVKYFLGFVVYERKQKGLSCTSHDVHKYIFKKDVEVFSRYTDHLVTLKQVKPSTVVNHILDLKKWGDYIRVYRKDIVKRTLVLLIFILIFKIIV